MSEVVTADLSHFGGRELREAIELLNAYMEQNTDYLGSGLTVNFNTNSGYVFLSDEDYNTAMMNGDKLEQWFSCPYCGHEGFLEDMKHDAENQECTDYMEEIGVK